MLPPGTLEGSVRLVGGLGLLDEMGALVERGTDDGVRDSERGR